MNEKIDFVIIWVDGSDKKWQEEKAKYSPNKKSDSRDIRYRDWDNLKYWFRGVEKYAPWVNKIYFVTCGHYPEWLNKENPKLVCVKHSDYMPGEYLPTFSANPIELNLHRIKGLSEKFVYFNDDMFIVNPVKQTDFFKKDKPCAMAVFNPLVAQDEVFCQIINNDNLLLNRSFNKKEILKNNKYLNIKYGKYNLMTLLCLPWNRIQGFYDSHSPNSFLKSTFQKVWEKEFNILDQTSRNKFRSPNDVNQYIFKYWQFCEGNFYPSRKISQFCKISDNVKKACDLILSKKYKLICLNDGENIDDFEKVKQEINMSFEKKLPNKSSFEK